MIPQEKQVTNLELSKRLAAAGVPQETSFWRHKIIEGLPDYHCFVDKGNNIYGETGNHSSVYDVDERITLYAAHSSAELGEWLPKGKFPQICPEAKPADLESNVWVTPSFPVAFETRTEADARGEMLLYLITNGYIKPEELE